MGRFSEKINQEHYESLIGTNWLNDCIVDYCNATYVRPGQFCFALGESTLALKDTIKRFPLFSSHMKQT